MKKRFCKNEEFVNSEFFLNDPTGGSFWEVDERGVFTELSRFACGVAPCGGEVVYAHSKEEAVDLYYLYRNGETSLKGTLWLPNDDYPYRNVISL